MLTTPKLTEGHTFQTSHSWGGPAPQLKERPKLQAKPFRSKPTTYTTKDPGYRKKLVEMWGTSCRPGRPLAMDIAEHRDLLQRHQSPKMDPKAQGHGVGASMPWFHRLLHANQVVHTHTGASIPCFCVVLLSPRKESPHCATGVNLGAGNCTKKLRNYTTNKRSGCSVQNQCIRL